jgi:hypothetical protein
MTAELALVCLRNTTSADPLPFNVSGTIVLPFSMRYESKRDVPLSASQSSG